MAGTTAIAKGAETLAVRGLEFYGHFFGQVLQNMRDATFGPLEVTHKCEPTAFVCL